VRSPLGRISAALPAAYRIYYQVQQSGYGEFRDLPTCFAQAGDFYLLQAVQAPDLGHATVVVSY
jgi:hypothetical protein